MTLGQFVLACAVLHSACGVRPRAVGQYSATTPDGSFSVSDASRIKLCLPKIPPVRSCQGISRNIETAPSEGSSHSGRRTDQSVRFRDIPQVGFPIQKRPADECLGIRTPHNRICLNRMLRTNSGCLIIDSFLGPLHPDGVFGSDASSTTRFILAGAVTGGEVADSRGQRLMLRGNRQQPPT